MRSIIQYEQNSSYCHTRNFEAPQRTTIFNNTLTVILGPCEQCPTSTNYNTPPNTPEPPHDMTGESPTIIIAAAVGTG